MTAYRCDGCGGPLPADENTAYCDECERTADRIETDRDLAVIARIGGNLYRERIASGHWRTEGPLPGTIMSTYSPSSMAETDRYVAGDAESLYAGNSYRRGQYSPPFTYTDGRTDAAVFHGFQHIMSRRPDMRAMLPESAFAWPVYRAALTAWINDVADATCADCGHNEQDHSLDPSTGIAWCYWCHDEYRPFDG